MKRFGVELELMGNLSVMTDALRDAGLRVRSSTHTHLGFSQTEWTVKRDGTVPGGGEVCSPPLDFDNPEERAQVTTAVQALQDCGAQPADCAGIHVHIEAKDFDGFDMTARQIASVVRFTYKFEDLMYRLASSGWNRIRPGVHSFARPIPEAHARAIMEVKDRYELERAWDGQTRITRRRQQYGSGYRSSIDRYTATNLRSYFDKGTIEMRYFNSSVNPIRVQCYVALCMAIVDDARHGFSRSVAKHYPVGSVYNGDVKAEAMFLRFQQIMRSESKDTKILMSTEDWKNLRKYVYKDSKPQARSWVTY